MTSTILENVRAGILEHLSEEQLTHKQLKRKMPQVATSTLYKALQQLQTEGQVRKVARLSGREAIFTLGQLNPNEPITMIPSLTFQGDTGLSIYFLDPKNFEVILKKLNENLILQLTRIFKQAEHLEAGTAYTTVERELKKIRLRLAEGQSQLHDLFDLFDQMLKEPRFWDPNLLSKFPQDPNWRESKIAESLAFFNTLPTEESL